MTPARSAGGAEVLVERVSKSYGRGVVALRDVSLEIAPNEFVSLTGPPGSGKSTLLNLIAGFSRPDLGSISVAGLSPWAVRERGVYRREVIGFVFQMHRLLPALSACGNVEVALVGAGVPRGERHERAALLLEQVGVGGRADHFRTSSPVASASVSRLPVRSRTARGCCWQMSRRRRSTRRRRSASSACSTQFVRSAA